MTTPVLPDTADLSTFGGTFVNVAPVVDPTTDMDATYQNRINAQLAMLSHTAVRAWARVTISGTTPTVADHDAVWGGTPAVAPSVTRDAPGQYTVTWASSYDDLQSTAESHSVLFRTSLVNVWDTVAPSSVSRVHLGNTVNVIFADNTGAAVDPNEFTVYAF